MQKIFNGSHHHKLERTGRATLPAEFRKQLQAEGADCFVLIPQMARPDVHSCFAPSTYAKMIDRLEAMPTSDADYETLNFLYVAQARNLYFDEQGRFSFPEDLRRQIGAGLEVTFVGAIGHFEIWEPRARQEVADHLSSRADPSVARSLLRGLR